ELPREAHLAGEVADLLEPFDLAGVDDQPGDLAVAADEVALVVGPRHPVLLALLAVVERAVGAGAELGVVAGGLIEPSALALGQVVGVRLVPVGVGGALEQAEVVGADPAAVGPALAVPTGVGPAEGDAVVPLEPLGVVARGVGRHHADV